MKYCLDQVHWPNPQVPLTESPEALGILRQVGKVRAIAVCNLGLDPDPWQSESSFR